MFFLLFCLLWIACTTGFLRHRIDENTEYKAHIDVEVFSHGRHRRTVDIKDHPESYDLVFLIERSKVHLHLVQNNDIRTKVPTFVLRDGFLIKDDLKDDEESTFYQDRRNGASFALQFGYNHSLNMFGSFIRNGEGYFLQTADTNGSINNREMQKFEIIKQKIKPLLFDDGEITGDNFQRNLHKSSRHRRATGNYQIELLMVCDYTVYNFWYTQSTKSTIVEKEKEAIESIRQFYAFVINGMDAVYKNIQTTSYTIAVLFSSLIISKTPQDASWTETVKKIDTPRNSINATTSLDKFKTWIKTKMSTLPVHDHAMLFSKYDLVGNNGSHDVAGLAYVGAICGESSQSIIEDDFDYSIIITTSHELGHSLSSQHDSKGNNCHESDGYVMAAVSTVHLGATATHPWIFSNCSTNYFTSKLDSLDSQNMNCMKTLGPSIDPTALAKYDKLYGGQAFDADAQCKHTHGNSSHICKGLFKGNYTTICNQMYCSLPTDLSNCRATKAWDRTVCGNKKWCVYGVCTNDVNAPVSNAGQLYDPDTQCRHIYGNTSGLCRGVYKGNFTSICGELYCTDPANPTSCKSEIAEEGTQCGNKKWCVDGACTFDTKAPTGIDSCLFGDKRGSVFNNGWSCSDMMRIAPNNCHVVPIKCCASCAPPTTTTSSSTSQPTTTITTPTTTIIHTTTTTPSTTIITTTTTIPTTTELSTTTTIPTTTELSTTTTIPTTTELSTTTPTPSTTKIPTSIPSTTKIPTIPTTTTISSTTLTPTTTKTPTTNTPSTASKTTETKVATPTTNYSTLKIDTNTTRNIENYSQHDTMLIALGTGVAVLISLVLIFIVVCRKKIRRAKVKDIEAKKKSSRRKRDKGNVNRETANHIMVSGNTRTQTTMKIRY